jgi:hypothetical protein
VPTEYRSIRLVVMLERLGILVDGKCLSQQVNAWQSAGIWLNFLKRSSNCCVGVVVYTTQLLS